MTGSNSSDSKSSSFEESACSEEEKDSDSSLQGVESDKISVLSEKSNRTDATYTCVPSIGGGKQRCKVNYADSQNNSSETRSARPKSRLQRSRSSRGILDQTTQAAKRAQWLPWNDPAFARRRSTEDTRFHQTVIKQTGQQQKSIVASFRRSLKLLGLQTSDLGINDEDIKDKRSETASSRGTATPTFSTKLKQRSVSLTNLRNAVQESGLSSFDAIEKMHRDVLSRAVYEEWYFRKLAEERNKRAMEAQIQKKKQEEMYWLKLEQRKRSEENFEKWKKKKNDEMRKSKDIPEKAKKAEGIFASYRIQKPHSPYPETRPPDKKAFELWKAKKDEEVKAKMDSKKRIEEEKKKNEERKERKASAEAAFKAWKLQADEELKQKMKEIEKKEREIKERERQEIKDKKETAFACYESWRKKKDEEMKQKIKLERLRTRRAAEEEVLKKLERLYEGAQAFEEWLDHVEEREESGRKNRSGTNHVPPWYPAGVRMRV